MLIWIKFWNEAIFNRKEYEGTGRNMFLCVPQILGKYPDWMTREQKFLYGNYTPALTAHLSRLKDWDYIYNLETPFVDICMGIGIAIMAIGVPGKFVLPQFTKCVMVTRILIDCLLKLSNWDMDLHNNVAIWRNNLVHKCIETTKTTKI